MHACARATRRRPRGPPPLRTDTCSPCLRRAGRACRACGVVFRLDARGRAWCPRCHRNCLRRRDGVGSVARSRRRRMGDRRGQVLAGLTSPQLDQRQVMAAARIGSLRLHRRPPDLLWKCRNDIAIIAAGDLGFAGAPEPDRLRWLNGFRRLLDGLDSPLQVVISAVPGTQPDTAEAYPVPHDFDDMRAADIWFADRVGNLETTSRRSVTFATDQLHSVRLESALRDLGVATCRTAEGAELYGLEQPDHLEHQRGWSRTWYVDRLPGTELEPGWLHRLIPTGLRVRLAWHAAPLPTAWVVDYLQRQLVSMRATRIQKDGAGSSDSSLAIGLPAAEDLQRRLAASQEKAFHVAIYLTLITPTRRELDAGSEKLESAARAAICRLLQCTFRMADGHIATLPGAEDRMQRRRVLDTSALATFLPWLDVEISEPGGLVLGRSRATGAEVMLDPFDQRKYANANIGVFGHSGAGKTYLL